MQLGFQRKNRLGRYYACCRWDCMCLQQVSVLIASPHVASTYGTNKTVKIPNSMIGHANKVGRLKVSYVVYGNEH